MSRVPRLVPLVGVAIVGVLGLNLLAGANTLPDALKGARAWAEELADGAKPAEAAADEAAAEVAAPDAETAGDAAAAAPQTPLINGAVCAPTAAELAREAGLSPNELMVLQRLGERRTELDTREGDIDTQIQLLTAAEGKIDGKINTMRGLIQELQTLLGQVDAAQEAETARLVKVYETMRPQSAAAALAVMDDEVRLPIMAKMKEAKLAALMRYLTPQQAREVTEKLARRNQEAFALAEARQAAASGAPPAATAAASPGATPPAGAAPAPAARANPQAQAPSG